MVTDEHDGLPAPGDPHQALIEAVHGDGPTALTAMLGDQGFALKELALRPRELFTPGDAAAGTFTSILGGIHELRSAMDALEARTVVALADSLVLQRTAEAHARAAQEDAAVPSERALRREAHHEAAREVSMLIRKSPAAAAHSLASQRRLVADMPEMLSALASAQITSTVAHRASRSFAVLSPARRAHADRLLGQRLPDLDGAGAETWNDAASAAIAASDPHGQRRRHQQAMKDRHVTVRRAEHGMATVTARVSALDGARIRKRLSLEAERLRAAGDRRGHQAIQSDSFVSTLLGQEDGMVATTLDIGVMITERSLIHPGAGDLAQIEGYGTAPAEVLREELRGPLGTALTKEAEEVMGPDGPALAATLRKLYRHPRSGELVAVESRARAFPAALATFIRWRDQLCRAPFCDAPIRQIDHITPYSLGGATCLRNGQGLCALCNAKERHLRSVRRVGDAGTDGHAVEWTSRAGTRRTTRPRRLTAPEQSTGPGPAPTRTDSTAKRRRKARPRRRRPPPSPTERSD